MIKKYSVVLIIYQVLGIVQLHAQGFINGSFETWGNPSVCEINVSPDGWTNYSTGCVAFDEANQLLCTSTIPGAASNGNIYARACAGPDWQGGEGVYQMVNNLNPGQSYTISFDYAGSNLYGGTDSVTWRVFVNDTLITQTPYFSSLQANWTTFVLSFVASQSTQKIGFRSYFKNPCVTCGGSSGIDNIKFNEMPTELPEVMAENGIRVYPNPASSSLMISSNLPENLQAEVYDLHSKKILKRNFNSSVDMNIDVLVPGLYLCLVRQEGNIVFRGFFTKK